MAKKTLIIDDLTGETGARTRTLAFEGVEYEVDLTDASFSELKSLLKPYLRAGRATSGRAAATAATRVVRRRPGAKAAPESAVIRGWARSVGMPVTERGRVPAPVREAWIAAGSPR